MSRHVHRFLIASALVAGCTEDRSTPTEAVSRGPVVYASNYPLQYFVERIAGPVVEARLRVPPDQDPAYWKPSVEDVVALQAADLVVLNGASYERWLDWASLAPSRTVDASDGFRDRWIATDEAVTHSHGPEGAHEHSPTAFTTWLDLSLAVEQARAIKDALAARWPAHQDAFESGFSRLAGELSALDVEIRAIVSANPDRPVLFSHPVYQYLQARYGIQGRSLHWEPDAMPTEDQWAELEGLLRDHRARWMLWEAQPDAPIVERLEGLGLGSAVVSPCGNVPREGDLLSVFRQNVEALRRVFGPRTEG